MAFILNCLNSSVLFGKHPTRRLSCRRPRRRRARRLARSPTRRSLRPRRGALGSLLGVGRLDGEIAFLRPGVAGKRGRVQPGTSALRQRRRVRLRQPGSCGGRRTTARRSLRLADAARSPVMVSGRALNTTQASGDHGQIPARHGSRALCRRWSRVLPLATSLGAATAAPPACITATDDEVSFTSTCSPMSEWSIVHVVDRYDVVVRGSHLGAAPLTHISWRSAEKGASGACAPPRTPVLSRLRRRTAGS